MRVGLAIQLYTKHLNLSNFEAFWLSMIEIVNQKKFGWEVDRISDSKRA